MGGKNVIVEIDEALLGKRKTMKHGNYPEILKFWVLGITERKPANKKNSKYVIIPNRSKNTLEKIIKDSVNKNSICTDEWSGYKGLKNLYRKHCKPFKRVCQLQRKNSNSIIEEHGL